MITATERLAAQRPDLDRLWSYRRTLARPLAIAWTEVGIESPDIPWQLGPELARRGGAAKYAATYYAEYEGTFAVILDVREGALAPGETALGTCELGTIVDAYDWYRFGASLPAVFDAGVRLGWTAATWLYAAVREELVGVHHARGHVHGALTPSEIRLALFATPYGADDHERGGDPELVPPVLLPHATRREGDDGERARELAICARTVAELTRHPDPEIDTILRDPARGSIDVVRDLVLERGEPIPALLRDLTGATPLSVIPLAEEPGLDDELRALWRNVIELDPMMESVPLEITRDL